MPTRTIQLEGLTVALVACAAGGVSTVAVLASLDGGGFASMLIFIWIAVVAVGVGVTLELPAQQRSLPGYVAKGACVGALIAFASVFGSLLPYLTGMAGLELDDYGGDAGAVDTAVLSFFLAGAAGAIIGLLCGAVVGGQKRPFPTKHR